MPSVPTLPWRRWLPQRKKHSLSKPSPFLALPLEILLLILQHIESSWAQGRFRLGLPVALISRDILPILRDPGAIADRAIRRFGNPPGAFINECFRFPQIDQPVIAAIAVRGNQDSFHIVGHRDWEKWERMVNHITRFSGLSVLRDALLVLASSGIVPKYSFGPYDSIWRAFLSPNDTYVLQAVLRSNSFRSWRVLLGPFKEACVDMKNLVAAELLLDKMLEGYHISDLTNDSGFIHTVYEIL
ncbi:hypothetical protein HDU93_006179, partial [Gonapodya sp. JEL0774]